MAFLGLSRTTFVLILALISTAVSSLFHIPGIVVIGAAALLVFVFQKTAITRNDRQRRRRSNSRGGPAELCGAAEGFAEVLRASETLYRALAAYAASLKPEEGARQLDEPARATLSAAAEATALLEAAILPDDAVRAMAGAEGSPTVAARAEAAARGAGTPEEQERLIRELLEAVSSEDASSDEEDEEGQENGDTAGARKRR